MLILTHLIITFKGGTEDMASSFETVSYSSMLSSQ
nr:MAG TPA: hypothetical protein [Bacteriophage sp.]